MKQYHDLNLAKGKPFKEDKQVLLYNSRLRLIPMKVKSRWLGSFTITQVFSHWAIEITHPKKGMFKVNAHRLKLYHGGDFAMRTKKYFSLGNHHEQNSYTKLVMLNKHIFRGNPRKIFYFAYFGIVLVCFLTIEIIHVFVFICFLCLFSSLGIYYIAWFIVKVW